MKKKTVIEQSPDVENPEAENNQKLMDRKTFLKKSGFIALTAASMLILNKPGKALASSPASMPAWSELKKLKK
jgi:hypothetical protein